MKRLKSDQAPTVAKLKLDEGNLPSRLAKSAYSICRAAFPNLNPDWRKPYSYVARSDDEAIAFEFMRRNKSYWEAFASRAAVDPMEWPAELPPSRFWSETTTPERFGLWKFCDPRRPLDAEARPWLESASLTARYREAINTAETNKHFLYVFLEPGLWTVRVDLLVEGPIEEQIEFVRWLLKRAQRELNIDKIKAPRFRRRAFPRYLALLDARDDGASFKNIAKDIGDGTSEAAIDRIKKQFRAAAALRDGGYRNILTWGRVKRPDKLPG